MDDAVSSVRWMVRGAWVTMALRAGVALRLFDALTEPVSAETAAVRTASDPTTLSRLLRAYVSLGLVRADGGTYRNTELGECLTEGHPSRSRDLVLMQATMPNMGAWQALDDAMRSGRGVFEQVNGVPVWRHLSEDPVSQRTFNATMARRASAQVDAVRAAIDLSEAMTLVDIGGGRGAMVAGLLEAHPHLTGVLADQPDVAAEAEEAFAAVGLSARAMAAGCDFFSSVPGGGDVYTISNVLHDWNDDDATAILRTVRAAMPDHARLLVVEQVLDAPGRSFDELRDLHLVDLHMLVLFGARERTQAEYDALLSAAGFTASRLAEPVSEWNVLEAHPV